jgi:hypothetical protein
MGGQPLGFSRRGRAQADSRIKSYSQERWAARFGGGFGDRFGEGGGGRFRR